MANSAKGFGPHLALDLYGCDRIRLEDYNFLYNLLDEMPKLLGMHKFGRPMLTEVPPQIDSFDKGGFTGFVILVESHLAVHTFPSDGFVSFDIFSCKRFDKDVAVNYLTEKFCVEKVELNAIERGKSFIKHYPKNILQAKMISEKERKLTIPYNTKHPPYNTPL